MPDSPSDFLKQCRLNYFLIIGILLVTAISISLRAYIREPVSDDLLYGYVLDNKPLGDNNYSEKVTSLSDAVRSQSIQYFYSNGRTLVHILVQMFAGVWGRGAYSIFLGCLMLSVIALFVAYTIPEANRKKPLIWLLVSVTFLYLFQNNSGIWYSIAGGLNYLFPIFLVIGYLLLLNKALTHDIKPNIIIIFLTILYAFITGWSQECYALPLSGGVFIYMIINRKELKSFILVLALPLWIGTAILVFAPGNFIRLGSGSSSILHSFLKGIYFLIGTRLFWLMLLGLILLRIKYKSKFKSFISANKLNIYILGIAIAFGMVANTLPQSFNGISFYSSILLFKLLQYGPFHKAKQNYINLITIACLVILCIHQYRIISAQIEMKRINHAFVNEYLQSPTGVLAVPKIYVSPDVRPFVNNWFTSSTRWWLMHTLNAHYMKRTKPITLLEQNDYEAYSNPELFMSKRQPINKTYIYRGEDYIWSEEKYAPMVGDTLYLSIKPSTIRKTLNIIKRENKINSQKIDISITPKNILKSKNGFVGISVGSYKINDIEIRKSRKQ